MIQVWTTPEKRNDKVIAVGDNIIYKANPKTNEEAEYLAKGMRSGSFDKTIVWEIKTTNCKEIRLQEGIPFIELLYGKEGEEQLRITDEFQRYKIFECIKENTPGADYRVEKLGITKTARKQIIASVVVLVLFLWTLYFTIQAQSGNEYYMKDGNYSSLVGITLVIASMGLAKVILLFSALLAVALFALFRKIKNRRVMNRLIIKH